MILPEAKLVLISMISKGPPTGVKRDLLPVSPWTPRSQGKVHFDIILFYVVK